MFNEVWVDILGNSKYFVSNYGRIKNAKGQIMTQATDKYGYKMLNLYYDGKHRTKKVHRLVAEAFIPNPNNLPCINHKDENKQNNNVDNLEWCSVAYNNDYGNRQERRKEKISKPVLCIELNITFKSAKEASLFANVAHSSICDVCNGTRQRKTTGGYHWKYVEEEK